MIPVLATSITPFNFLVMGIVVILYGIRGRSGKAILVGIVLILFPALPPPILGVGFGLFIIAMGMGHREYRGNREGCLGIIVGIATLAIIAWWQSPAYLFVVSAVAFTAAVSQYRWRNPWGSLVVVLAGIALIVAAVFKLGWLQ
jgi:hypothetical protein